MDAEELFEEGKRWIRERYKEGYCPRCGKPLPPRRQTWCSDECANWWWGTYHWGTIAKRILERDNYTCKICGRQIRVGVRVEVHHIKPWTISHDNSDANLITVCRDCHRKLHANHNWSLMAASKVCRKLDDFGRCGEP